MEYKQIGSRLAELSAALLSVDRTEVQNAIETLRKAREEKKNVWIIGNGGSAATASHFANDLTKIAEIKAFAIPDMTPVVTAYGNDNGWEYMFAHVLDVYYEPGDVIVAISCSGKSQNVLEAVKMVPDLIVLTGNNHDAPLAKHLTKAVLIANHADITIQEDIHLAICHTIAKGLEL